MRSMIAGLLAAACLWGPAQAQVSDDVVKIGVLNDMTGPFSDIVGESDVVAARLAIEDFGGTVLGKKIELVVADHQNKADVGSAVARRWFDEDKVDAIAGLGASSVALAVRALTRDRGKVDLATSTGTPDMTGSACSRTGFQWNYDTYALAKVMGTATRSQGDTWFLLAADYAFGHALANDLTKFVTAAGGKVLGVARHPLNSSDFSSYLLQAKASGAQIVGLANFAYDALNSIKGASEFGLVAGGQKVVGLLIFVTDVRAIGLAQVQGLLATESFYWDMNDETRSFARRFNERRKGFMPNSNNAAMYSAVLHYLRGVQAAGTDEGAKVADAMRAAPINDMSLKNGSVREDGRVMRPMYLLKTKPVAQSKGEWDVYDVVATVAPEDAWRPLAEGGCPYVQAKR